MLLFLIVILPIQTTHKIETTTTTPHSSNKSNQQTNITMMSRSLLFLGAISLYGATSVSGAGLRKALQQEEELTCLLSTLHTTYMGNDEQKSHGEETICALVQDGVPTPIAYPIVLPSEFLEQHESNIERGRLLVSIRGASLVAGEYVLEDDQVSEITVIDENFSPKSSPGRKLLEAKDPTDAFGQRRLIVFRVNGVAGEPKVRMQHVLSIFHCFNVMAETTLTDALVLALCSRW
jgi:hypothetical protein